jgi:hypothetical protein
MAAGSAPYRRHRVYGRDESGGGVSHQDGVTGAAPDEHRLRWAGNSMTAIDPDGADQDAAVPWVR